LAPQVPNPPLNLGLDSSPDGFIPRMNCSLACQVGRRPACVQAAISRMRQPLLFWFLFMLLINAKTPCPGQRVPYWYLLTCCILACMAAGYSRVPDVCAPGCRGWCKPGGLGALRCSSWTFLLWYMLGDDTPASFVPTLPLFSLKSHGQVLMFCLPALLSLRCAGLPAALIPPSTRILCASLPQRLCSRFCHVSQQEGPPGCVYCPGEAHFLPGGYEAQL
jgi:hypothetical protein